MVKLAEESPSQMGKKVQWCVFVVPGWQNNPVRYNQQLLMLEGCTTPFNPLDYFGGHFVGILPSFFSVSSLMSTSIFFSLFFQLLWFLIVQIVVLLEKGLLYEQSHKSKEGYNCDSLLYRKVSQCKPCVDELSLTAFVSMLGYSHVSFTFPCSHVNLYMPFLFFLLSFIFSYTGSALFWISMVFYGISLPFCFPYFQPISQEDAWLAPL